MKSDHRKIQFGAAKVSEKVVINLSGIDTFQYKLTSDNGVMGYSNSADCLGEYAFDSGAKEVCHVYLESRSYHT